MDSTIRHRTISPPGFLTLTVLAFVCLAATLSAASFDAAPFGLALPPESGSRSPAAGVLWEDPREIHEVAVRFATAPPHPESLRLEYWGSRWPEQHLPKDREPGGGDVGWMELGNWHKGGWRVADTETETSGSTVTFRFRPVNAKEFPKLKGCEAAFRYTLKLRLVSETPVPAVQAFQAFTDSGLEPQPPIRIAWARRPAAGLNLTAFNGAVKGVSRGAALATVVSVLGTVNSDPNTFDRTLVTVHNGKEVFTFALDDLRKGPLFLPQFGAAILPEADRRSYQDVAGDTAAAGARTLYDQVAALPEQNWRSAWENMPAKRSHIYVPLSLDGGRQRFMAEADGTLGFRFSDHYLRNRPGADTARLDLEAGPVRLRFGLPHALVSRGLQEASLPICETAWETNGLVASQTVLVTRLDGMKADGTPPAADDFAVLLARFVFTNASTLQQNASLPLSYHAGNAIQSLRIDSQGFLWAGEHLRGQVIADTPATTGAEQLTWSWSLAPGESRTVVVKAPYLILTAPEERQRLAALDFEKERAAVAGYWRRRLNESARLVTPEPMLNEFYRAQASHLLMNCEREPNSTRRFARVGSFAYGAYGNESCMMVVDLDRRGYHREAEECLEAWLHYQGTVGLPGSFSSRAGVLYGAGGYEAGGYNQHHGWILWMLAEHYRFTRDRTWLSRAAPGMLAGAEWIIRETARTADRHQLERGLLPAGSLEDIGDWWTWLSTSCYTWRGLDSAAWALEQIQHPQARRIRQAADRYHAALLANFQKASERSPVVRLRDGTAVPKIPSYVHRRGRSFGWICETLEGSLHLLITGALAPRSPEAEWIVKDYEDNLYLSNQYGYTLPDFDRYWFGRGGMSMQACLLLDVEPYLYRDDVKHALRAMFNAIAVSYFPDERMNTEHALPAMGDWRGDHYKSSDEANACGWLRQIFVREEGHRLLVGQAVPRDWLRPGQSCGLQRAATYFGPASVLYEGSDGKITATIEGPTRNPPAKILLRFRTPGERAIARVTVNGKPWRKINGDWVELPGNLSKASVVAEY